MLGITVIGYDEQGNTVVNVPDLNELERLGVHVEDMPRNKYGHLKPNADRQTTQGRAILTAYHPVGYEYKTYRSLLRTLTYAGNVLRNSMRLEFCRNRHADYEWEGGGEYKCVHCGAEHRLGYETSGHQYGYMFTSVD